MKLILGMGITGLSAARFFAKNNEIFRIVDSRKNPALLKVFQEENLLDDCYFGDWNESILKDIDCLLYTSPSPRDGLLSRMPSSA